MITQYEVTHEFTYKTEFDILVPISVGVIFTINLVSCKYDSLRKLSLGSWSEEMEKEIGDIITITEEFIIKNPHFFKSLAPNIFGIGEVRNLIKDIKKETDGGDLEYFVGAWSVKSILAKFIKKTVELNGSAKFNK